MDIPLLGMGTWGMGGKFEKDSGNIKESVEALKYGISKGIKLIDVAEIYGQGLTEEIVGEAIGGFRRSELFIISKVWKTNLHYDDVFKSIEGSLKRLKTDYIDLYLIHWPNPEVSLEETIKALVEAKEKGFIRHIGVSNFTVELMEETINFLGKEKLDANQVEYSLTAREAEKEIIPFCQENGIRVIAYRPLARGILASSGSNILKELSLKYKKTSVQIMLNWFISRGIVVIPKAINKRHLEENWGAVGWRLAPEDIELINSGTF